MKIYKHTTIVNKSFIETNNLIKRIRINEKKVAKMIDLFSLIPNGDTELLKILQKLQPDIEEIDTATHQYVIRRNGNAVRLGFISLSTSEKLFMTCFIADKLKTSITVCDEISQLDMPYYRLFFDMFYSSDYINILVPNEYTALIISDLEKRTLEE